MKLVDVRTYVTPVAAIYGNVPQPMTVYHSTEEFEANVQNPVRIQTFGQLLDFTLSNNISLVYTTDNRYVDVKRFNIWIKSVDRFKPDYADKYGNIMYQKGEDGEAIPTDGCWLQLFYITPTPAKLVLFTSAGINTAGITKWTVTGAVRPAFIQESEPDKRAGSATYEAKLNKILSRRKPDVKFTKLALAFLSSDSESFLDINKSASVTFGHAIRAADRERLFESPAFKESIMSVIKTLFPTLAPAIRAEHNPEKLAAMLKTMWNVAEASKDVDKMVKVFDKITETGYQENTAINDQRALPIPAEQLTDGKPTANEISFPDPYKLSTKVVTDDNDDTDEEEIEALKADLDYPDGFIMPDIKETEGKE